MMWNNFLAAVMPTMVTVFIGIATAFGFWAVSKLNAAAKSSDATHNAVADLSTKNDATAAKVATIETHTNGMLTALQGKVDAAALAKTTQAQLTAKDVQIAELTSKIPSDDVSTKRQ